MSLKRTAAAVMTVVLLAVTLNAGQETPERKAERMQWFADSKLGIFIHWGIYAVNGIDESWSFYNGYISYGDYLKQLSGFTASKYDPDAWAQLIKESGARYAVLTTKHHDGVALWNTAESDLSVAKKTPAGRDLVGPFCQAVRGKGLKAGLYFSHLDWSHPDYPFWTKDKKRYNDDPGRWCRFLDFHDAQLMELADRYKPDLLWFDGDWDYPAEKWGFKELRQKIFGKLPNVILNSRLGGAGDYATPEQGLPVLRPKDEWWELCLTMNDSWGWQPNDKNYKTPNQLIRIFADCLSLGGNLLLDIGPKADGTIPAEQVRTLKELGRWTGKHAEGIYGTIAGIPAGHFYGPTTLSKDRETLYLFLDSKPLGPIVVKGLKNQINRIRVVGEGTKLSWKVVGKQFWSDIPGLLYIDVPESVLDPQVTVIAVQLKGPIELHREYD